MHLRVLSYNLKSHAAYHEVAALAKQYQPDVICLQETRPSAEIASPSGFELAHKTGQGRYGLAVHYASKVFSTIQSNRHDVGLSAYERRSDAERERLLIVHLRHRETKREVTVGCFHATHPGAATNNLRRQQVQAAISHLQSYSNDAPALLIGDYNYPFFIKGLHTFVLKHGFQLAVSDQPTFKNKFFSGKLDFAAARHVQSLSLEVLPFGASDHRPVMATITI